MEEVMAKEVVKAGTPDEARQALVPASEKPLNQTQLKNLERLVEGDFADLQDAVRADIE
jgi:hypothetical protein